MGVSLLVTYERYVVVDDGPTDGNEPDEGRMTRTRIEYWWPILHRQMNCQSFKQRKKARNSVGARRVGIVGLGSIGSEIAKRLESFGCHISYNSKKRKPSVPYPYFSSVHELAIDSDVLIVCCTLTEETYHLITRDVLLALGKNGILINVGRGAHVDEKELVQCLVRGEIGGVGLDVMEDEPNVPKELYELDNVVLSPHKAVFTNESFSNVHEHILGMLEAYFSKKPLLSSVI
ncbi:hypothetical protein Sjap_005032 [Stephania japonica]|uniref:D-isomer specific 2-hydroxyacid dehydrogenase NAD-binding domain-containing protein n=1 Tax=Stephania japonica TaxID=461633 RepID=A0AAP0K4L8_9MAGN